MPIHWTQATKLSLHWTIRRSSLFFISLLVPTLSHALYGVNNQVRPAKKSDRLEAIAQVGRGTGVLIGSNVILTAGHVIKFGTAKKEDLKISFPESSQPERLFAIEDWKAADHGIFETRYLDHSGQDLAVIFLKENVKETLRISPVALYKKPSSLLIGKKVLLAGFGRYQLNENGFCMGKGSRELLVARSEVKELLNLEGRWGAPLIIGNPEVTPCDGDSGGPALVYEKQSIYVVGITSGPYGSIAGGHLGRSFQYADIYFALGWLSQMVPEVFSGQ